MKMATVEDTKRDLEYNTLKNNFVSLVEVIAENETQNHLFQEGVISFDVFCCTSDKTQATSLDKGKKIMIEVLKNVKGSPKLFGKVCEALEKSIAATDVLQKVKGWYLI